MLNKIYYQQRRQISFRMFVIQTKYRMKDLLAVFKSKTPYSERIVDVDAKNGFGVGLSKILRWPGKTGVFTSKKAYLSFSSNPLTEINRTNRLPLGPLKKINFPDKLLVRTVKVLLLPEQLLGTAMEKIKIPKNLITSIGVRIQFPQQLGRRVIERVTFPDRLRGTIVEKWVEYWKNLSFDYYEVYKDSVKTLKEKPRRTLLLASIAGLCTGLAITNPDEVSYRDAFLRSSNDLSLIGPDVQNPQAVNYIRDIEKRYNQGTIRCLNLGLFSLVWAEEYDDVIGMYRAQCSYLQPRYISFYEKVLDVGFFNTWWFMEKNMTDYDVNPQEWNKHGKT